MTDQEVTNYILNQLLPDMSTDYIREKFRTGASISELYILNYLLEEFIDDLDYGARSISMINGLNVYYNYLVKDKLEGKVIFSFKPDSYEIEEMKEYLQQKLNFKDIKFSFNPERNKLLFFINDDKIGKLYDDTLKKLRVKLNNLKPCTDDTQWRNRVSDINMLL